MPTYNPQPPREQRTDDLLPDGTYTYTVVKFDRAIQNGNGVTRGSDVYKVQLKCEPVKGTLCGLVTAHLIDHPNTVWKLNTFLEASNAHNGLKDGCNYTFIQSEEAPGTPWINPIGLRGHCDLKGKKLESGKMVTEVAAFRTDKPKLPREKIESSEPEVDWSAEQ